MQFCPSFQIVQLMREGRAVQEACNIAVERMLKQNGQWFEVAVIALDINVSSHYTKLITLVYKFPKWGHRASSNSLLLFLYELPEIQGGETQLN